MCKGENIQKCFTLDKVRTTQGDIYFDWQSRRGKIIVDLKCTNGLIHFRHVTFSIPKQNKHECLSDGCKCIWGDQKCDCCRKPPYSKHLCHYSSSVGAQWKDCYQSRKECILPINIMDLSGHCATHINYFCYPGWYFFRNIYSSNI